MAVHPRAWVSVWRRRAKVALAAAVVLVGLTSTTSARAETGDVRYSYEKVEIGPRVQWALLPRAEEELRGEIGPEKVQKAFELLSEEKETSYGQTTIQVGQVGDRLTAEVQIDPDYAKYQVIIKAEVVYTLTEMGVDEITFPGYADGPVTREEIAMTAYTATVPLWRALPPTGLGHAQVRLPDGELVPAAEVERRWERGDGALIGQFYSYLQADSTYTVTSVLDRVQKLDLDYASEVVTLLERDNREIQSAALDALADETDESEVREALVELVDRAATEELARRAAEMLGEVEARRYRVHKWFFLLENGEDDERVKAAEELAQFGGSKREAVVDHLDSVLRSDERSLASAAKESLVAHGAEESLVAALDDAAVDRRLRLQIAEALTGRSSSDAQIAGYRYLAANASGRPALQALESLAAIEGSRARSALESFLTADDRRRRRRAVALVEERGELASLPALARGARSGAARRMEGAILAILSEASVSTILGKTESGNSVVQRVAYRALGQKARQETQSSKVFEALRDGVGHSDPAIRGAAARGLGQFADDRALAQLRKLVDDPSPDVRRGVARALSNFEAGTLTDRLVDYLDDESPRVVAGALYALAERGERRSWERIETLVAADDALVRQRAIEAVGALVPRDDEKAVRQAISLLSGRITSEDDPEVLRAALSELGTFEQERAVNGIAIMLNAKEKPIRLAALEALGKTGDRSAVSLVADVLDNSDPELRRGAVRALGRLGYASARPALEEQLNEEENESIGELIRRTLQKL